MSLPVALRPEAEQDLIDRATGQVTMHELLQLDWGR
jgi:hypothetical protein